MRGSRFGSLGGGSGGGGGGGPTVIDVQLVNGANNLAAPAGTPADGDRVLIRIAQPASGAAGTVTLNSIYRIPGSATSPLPFSTVNGRIDYLAAVYDASLTKWVIVSFIPHI
jgi:hypothetical protein